MFKPRAVIRAFTCRRDVASAMLLAKCLEHMNFNVIISSVRDFERLLKLWKPEVAITNIISGSYHIKKINPKIKTVFIDGEGILPESYKHHYGFKKNENYLKAIDLILLWGPQVFNEMKNNFPQYNFNNMHVIGYPALDLIKYAKKQTSQKKSKTIGFAMRSPYINEHLGRSVIRVLGNEGYLPRIIADCKGFKTTLDTIKLVLNNTSFDVSIRPHPYEQINSYNDYKKNWFGDHADRIKIDETLSFSEWASKQKVIISTSSFSVLQSYLLKKVTVNIDYLADIHEQNKSYDKVYETWQNSCYTPKSNNELLNVLKKGNLKFIKNQKLDDQLRIFCNWHKKGSANWKAAFHISDLVKNFRINIFSRLPTFMVDIIDNYSFWKACKKNKLHPNYHYKKGYHKPVENINTMLKNILEENKRI
tara:strand:+ start:683 stop:1942 length:1260 start_codon:yes stop_codon:yes gene_type:complete